MPYKIALMLLAMLISTSCVTSGPADSFCVIAKPIYFSSKDLLSNETERAIIAHDEKGAAICGWKPPGS